MTERMAIDGQLLRQNPGWGYKLKTEWIKLSNCYIINISFISQVSALADHLETSAHLRNWNE